MRKSCQVGNRWAGICAGFVITEYGQVETHIQTCMYIIHCALFASLQSLIGVHCCQAMHHALTDQHLSIFSSLSVLRCCTAYPIVSSSSPHHLFLKVLCCPAPLSVWSIVVKAELHRSTEEEEEEVEGGRGLSFLQIQAVSRVSGLVEREEPGGGLDTSGAAAPGYPRSWWGRSPTGRWSCPRTSSRRSDWSEWWCRPPWSLTRPRSLARSRRALDSRAGPSALRDDDKTEAGHWTSQSHLHQSEIHGETLYIHVIHNILYRRSAE